MSDVKTSRQLFEDAVADHQAGRIREAESGYRAVLAEYPDHPHANHNLGVMALMARGAPAALPYLQRALDADRKQVQFWITYATALANAGQLEAARRLVVQARAEGIGGEAFEQVAQQLNDPVPAMQEAVAANPDSAAAHNNLGAALKDQGRNAEAAASYRRAIELKPDLASAHSNLGNALHALKLHDEAAESLRRAVEIDPRMAQAHSNLGNVLNALGRFDEAVASFRRAIELTPDFAEAYSNLGSALQSMGRGEESLASFRRAVEIKPDLAAAHSNLGSALQAAGRIYEAGESFRRATELRPDFAPALSNLGTSLQETGRIGEAIDCFRRALILQPDFTAAHSNLLFTLNSSPDQDPQMLLAEARRFGDTAARSARPYTDWLIAEGMDRRLRIGLVSADLRNHPVGYFVEGVLQAVAANPASRLEVFAYINHHNDDPLTGRIKACCAQWRSTVGMSDERVAAQIRDDRVDVLIDLSGHTAHNRLPVFAWKPAPVQASWLGYFATTGVAAIDYLIGDRWVTPESGGGAFTETLYRLPDGYLCFTAPDDDTPVGPLPALEAGHVTFGSFNKLMKLNDPVVSLWARVLAAVPGSRLFVKDKQLGDADVRRLLADRFTRLGIDAARLIFEGPSPRGAYLDAYNRVDIALDPFPYNGCTTTAESLWMGTPVLTRQGDSYPSRMTETVLRNAGLTDWIAAGDDDYVSKAAAFASDLDGLSALRAGLRSQAASSPLCDAPRFARNFEQAMWDMWNGRSKSAPPSN